MATSIRGINVVIGAETTGLQKALSDVNKKSKDIQSELRRVERALKFNPNDTILLAQKQKLLADQVANTREKLDRLKAAQAQVNEQFRRGEISEGHYRAFQREIIETESKLKHFEQQLASTQKNLANFGKSMQDAGKSMTDAGKNLSMKVTAPIVGLGTVAAKAAIDFESAFAGIRKTVDATEEEFAELEQGVRDMSKRMPAAATDIAAVGEAAGQLGIKTPNILKFTETMIGLGEATNMTAEEGATQFARFANIVGMSQNDFDRLGSSVVGLGNNFATTEAEIVAMGMRLAGQGAQIGMTEAQIMALAAAMSSVGIEAEAGGTAMSTTLKKMQNAVSLGNADLDKFAATARMSSSEFAKAFSADPMAALQAFVAGLAESSGAGENLTLILNDLGISGIREADALLRLAGASDVLSEAVDISTQAWGENTALQEEVAQRYATTESQLKMLKNMITDIGIQIGDIIIPVMMRVAEAIKPVLDWFAQLSPEIKQIIVVVAGLAAAVGPLLILLGFMASGLGSILTIMPALKVAFAAMTGPIGIAVAVIATLVAMLVHLYRTNEDVRANMQIVWEAIKVVLEVAMKAILFVIESVWDNIKGVIGGALTFIQGIINVFAGILTGDFKTMWEGVKQIFSGAVEFIFNFVQLMFIGKIIAIFKNFAKAGFELLKGNWTNILNGVKQFGTSILNFFKGLWDNTISTFKNFSSTGTNIFNTLKNTLTGIVQGLINTVKNLFTGMSSSVTSTMSSLRASIQTIWNNIVSFFRGINLRNIGRNIIQGLINGITSMASEAMRAARNLADNVSSTIKNALKISSPSKVMEGYGKFISEGLAQGIDVARYKVSDSAAKLVGGVTAPAARGVAGVSVTGVGAVGGGGVTITGNTFYVRNDNDIRLIARELYNLQQQGARGRGMG